MNRLDRRQFFVLATAAGLAGGYGSLASAQAAAAPRPASDRRSARPPIEFIEVNGTRLGYERHAARGGSRRPLVFVNGYALRSTGPIYAGLFERLTTEFEVYALDMRGHGGSAPSYANWTQAAIADDVAAFVAALDLRGAVYAGHSLGGFTGMFAQIRHPGTFAALALLATAAAAGDSPPAGLQEAFVRADPAQMRTVFASMYVHPGVDDVQRSIDAVTVINSAVHNASFPNYAANVITARLMEIRVPVLLVNGGRDTVVAPAKQHATAGGLPLSKEVILSREGHMLPIEAAEVTAREMLNFFRYDIDAMSRI